MKEEIMTYSVPRQGRRRLGEMHSRGIRAGQLQMPHLHASASQGLLRMGFKSGVCAGLTGMGFNKVAVISIQKCCLGLGLPSLADRVSV